MSASEKLKELDGQIHYDRGPAGRPTEERLFSALPQIVAVVFCAEQHQLASEARWRNLGNEELPLSLSEYSRTRDALAALDEALS